MSLSVLRSVSAVTSAVILVPSLRICGWIVHGSVMRTEITINAILATHPVDERMSLQRTCPRGVVVNLEVHNACIWRSLAFRVNTKQK